MSPGTVNVLDLANVKRGYHLLRRPTTEAVYFIGLLFSVGVALLSCVLNLKHVINFI